MTAIDFVAAIEREGTALGRTIAAGPHRRIACYPAWNVLDLVAHTGSVHRWVTGLVTSGARQPTVRAGHDDRDPDRLLEWFTGGLHLLVGTLRRVDPSRAVWTMAADQTVGFWRRRMAHETATHRWDAEHATGDAQPIDAQLAITGIAETLEIHVVRPLAGTAVGGRGERIGLHCTDLRGDWIVTVLADRVEVKTAAGPADATLAGSASSIWLSLMGRPAAEVETLGDASSVQAFRRALRLADRPSF